MHFHMMPIKPKLNVVYLVLSTSWKQGGDAFSFPACAPVPRLDYRLGTEQHVPRQRHCVVQVGKLKVPAGG